MGDQGLTVQDADALLDSVVDFPNISARFERVRPITNFRKDDSEARILYICRKLPHAEGKLSNDNLTVEGKEERYVLKCKVQAPSVLANGLTTPIPGPSDHTKAEQEALQRFADTQSPGLPHLLATKLDTQNEKGPMPGGYISYTVMTLMPGKDLMEAKFWSMPEAQQNQIRDAFRGVIKHVWTLGMEPYDCALRNILWEQETKKLSLVDFEHYHPMTKDPINMDLNNEMMRWGIVRRPAHTAHWKAWFEAEGLYN
ncbi:hypothetical protein CERZMDRAFT_121797 [Cercospora zeae-maydis SCOH1-5]|uniref:Aminoglycoside phosphotransferase domain-containing protein n=1 Tax=Cercospora zeae-maydis SCOH1-5 TaxID=717836 RepID=A0A6A6FAF2_9PEZI|nr:hypothetical protein CERZMDRAFT_121797 [Cercospora zeae-maydis SCOH1-5]